MKKLRFLLPFVLLPVVALVVACGGTEEVIKEVVVEKIVTQEVIKEVPVEKEVVKEVVKEVQVPGKTVVVEKEVVKEVQVPGKTVVVEKEVVKTVEIEVTPTPLPKATSGTIPGSVLTVALETVGNLTTEPNADIPVYGCRPGCLLMKDDMFLMDRVGNLVGHIVQEWSFGDDTKNWSLTMADDVKFFNGRTATLDDMVFSMFEGGASRVVGIPGAYGSTEAYGGTGRRSFYNDPFIDATRVEQIDNKTLEIDFKNPTIAIPQMTLTVNLDSRGLYSEQEIKALGWEEWLKNPILSGPYKKLKDVPGERKEFEVHVDWWKKPAPEFEKQIHMGVPESATRLAMLASKQADAVTLSALALNQALLLDHVKILQQPATVHLQFYFYNMLHQDDVGYDPDNPFYDVRVREAFAIAVDRQALVDTIYAGKSEVQSAPMMATGMRGWDHPIVKEMRDNPYEYNPERAKELLAEANFPMDRKVKVLDATWAPSGAPEKKEVTEAVVTQLRKALGLDIELVMSGSSGDFHKPQRYAEDKPAIDWDISGGGRNSTEPVITTRASYLHRRNVAYFLTDPLWSEMKAIDKVLNETSDLVAFDQATAEMSKLVRDNHIMIPLVTNPLFWGVVSDRIDEWPLTVGAPWPHYFEYITAGPGVAR